MKRILWIYLVFIISTALFSQELSISGVDPSPLLETQRVHLYLTLSGVSQEALLSDELGQLRLEESSDGVHYRPVEDILVQQDANLQEGISFFMLVDNSGSMYFTMEGRETDNPEETRIRQAEEAMASFLGSIEDSRDRISLASFNTNFEVLTENTSRRDQVMGAFQRIERPEEEQAYTELYAGLWEAAPLMAQDSRGRKVLVVLSDGENYPFYYYTGEPHDQHGTKLYQPEEAIEALQRQGITLFAINFANQGDPALEQIAQETGGLTFDASSSSELAGVYQAIRERLLEELRVSYRAGVYSSDRVWVRVSIPGDEPQERFYYNSGIFGNPSYWPLWIILLLLLLVLLGWLLLMKLRFERRYKLPTLEVVGGGLHQRMLELTKDRTVIGGSESHDLTIMGQVEQSQQESATIVYDKEKKNYTLIAQEATMVNNQAVTRKELETGDVIKVGDSLIIFDDEATKLSE